MSDLALAVFGLLAVVFAALVLVVRQPMRAALALVAHMTCLACVYACLEVHVVALFQVLIYVGAVMVFMVYTIMLLDDRDAAFGQRFSRTAVPALVGAALVCAGLVRWLDRAGSTPASDTVPSFGFAAFSKEFMQHYWLHFELATVLLLLGLVAAWVAIRENRS